MADGRISEIGTYQELLDRKGAFVDFLYAYLETGEMDEEADDNGIDFVYFDCSQNSLW